MTDIKEVFARVLDAPAPPMTAGEDLLAAASAAASRRRTVRGGAVALAAASAVALAVTAAPAVLGGTDPGPANPPPATATPKPPTPKPPTPIPPTPDATGTPTPFPPAAPGRLPTPAGTGKGCAGSAPPAGSLACEILAGPEFERARRLGAALRAAVPAGYEVPPGSPSFGATRHPNGETTRNAGVTVRRGRDQGYLVVIFAAGGSTGGGSAGDLCARPIDLPQSDCRVLTTGGGVRIRLSTVGQGSSLYYAAVRYYRDATVEVTHGATGGPMLSAGQLAELAARPEFGPR
jgi:hypothetical protein